MPYSRTKPPARGIKASYPDFIEPSLATSIDIRSGHTDFGHVLVYDVSRWGRFQDIDESAHYEFTCRKAGIKVAYCAEEFDNDGSLISSIVKNIKRVMAAEFSRELSVKVHAAASRMARLGFKMGGQVGYGLERFAVDENSHQKGILRPGEYKYLRTDRVRVQPGSPDESAVVRWIFEEFVQGKSQADIVRELNRRGIPRKNGLRWNRNLMCGLLRNEAYIGNLVWNRFSQKLGARKTRNQSDLWIRSEGCFEPTIDRDLFLRAKKILDGYRVCISEEEMLARVRKVLMKKGSLPVGMAYRVDRRHKAGYQQRGDPRLPSFALPVLRRLLAVDFRGQSQDPQDRSLSDV
jgi:DNA invertase Pin-like site-specific DNA recombinase